MSMHVLYFPSYFSLVTPYTKMLSSYIIRNMFGCAGLLNMSHVFVMQVSFDDITVCLCNCKFCVRFFFGTGYIMLEICHCDCVHGVCAIPIKYWLPLWVFGFQYSCLTFTTPHIHHGAVELLPCSVCMSVLRSYSGTFAREICFKNKLAFLELLLPKTTLFPSGTRDELDFVLFFCCCCLWSCSSGDVSWDILCPASRMQCMQQVPAGTLVVCSPPQTKV